MSNEEKSISNADLIRLLAEQQQRSDERMAQLIAAMQKPTVMEQKKLDEEAAAILAKNQERKDNAIGMKVKRDSERFAKHSCSHLHPNGNTHCVFIGPTRDDKVGYILCQRSQCIIRPEPAPANYDGDDIYDTAAFNRLFQSLPSQELFQ